MPQPGSLREHNFQHVQAMDRENINDDQPYLCIIEQPKSRGYRFRYDCEGGSHGNIYGDTTSRTKKTYPTVKICNFNGSATVSVNLVTIDDRPQKHTHELIGNDCKNGTCIVETKPGNNVVPFSGLAIKHCTRKRACEIMQARILEELEESKRKDFGMIDSVVITDAERKNAKEVAQQRSRDIDLSVVRLRFQATLKDVKGNFIGTLPEVISAPVYDAKSPGAAALKICRMDKSSGCCSGNEEVFLLCDKVQKDDISVCFQERDEKGDVMWEDYGSFGPQDVHRQFAIVFRTPKYRLPNITSPVPVKVKLKRMTKPEESNEVPFMYYPQLEDLEGIGNKRRKKLPKFDSGHGDTFGGFNNTSNFPSSGDGGGGNFGGGVRNQGHDGGQMRIPIGHPGVPMDSHTQARLPFPQKAFPRRPEETITQHQTTVDPGIFNIVPTLPNDPAISEPQFAFQPDIKPPNFIDFNFTEQPFMGSHPIAYAGRGVESPRPAAVPPPSQSPAVPSPVSDQPTDLSMKTTKIQPDCAKPTEDVGYVSCEGSLLASQNSIKMAIQQKVPALAEERKISETTPLNKLTTQQNTIETGKDEVTLAPELFELGDRLFKALQDFATTGDVGYLLLVQRRLLMQQDQNGDNILHLAVIYKKLHVLRDLLKVVRTLRDCDALNQTNNLLQTPLHLAVLLRDAQMVELLIGQNASLSAQDRNGNTPLHLAARCRAPMCLQYMLIGHAQRTGTTKPLCTSVNVLNCDGMSALHVAISQGHLECVKLLVERGGADVNIQDGKTGKTPLHYAVDQNELAILGYLAIETKAEVNMPCFNGATPLHTAVLQKHVGCVSILMASGADSEAEMVETVEDAEDEEQETEEEEEGAEGLSMKERLKHKQEREEKERELDSDESGDKDTDKDAAIEQDDTEREEGLFMVTPKMLAEGDDKLERILNGEECTEPMKAPSGSFVLSEHMLDLDPRTFNVVSATQRELSTVDLPEFTAGGNISDLDAMAKVQLARLLDPLKEGQDWKELAHRLNLADLISALEPIASPTKALIDNFEVLEGTLEQLETELNRMRRDDAIKIIQNVRSMKAAVTKSGFMGATSHVGQLQSNFASMNLKS